MRKILVLGAGMVAGPLIADLLDHGHSLTVTSLDLAEAERLIGGNGRGRALLLDLQDADRLGALVARHDLVISLVPYTFHPLVARQCLAHRRNLVTASYVSPEMQTFDAEARAKGLIFLNEIGLDPGIDHMSAMRIIDQVKARGGSLRHFRSYCGGLPAPDANDNPFGYKFSWAPRGVLMASRNDASYLKDGHEVRTPGDRLFRDMHLLHVPGAGDFEAYPNRDSLTYREVYGLGDQVQTVYRATLRNVGWCDTMHAFRRIGLLDDRPRPASGQSCAAYLGGLLGAGPGDDLVALAAQAMGVAGDCLPVANLAWLGLASDRPVGRDMVAPLDLLGDLMLEKLVFRPGERDMVVLFHEFKAWFPAEDRYERITSSLVDFGVPGGWSSMARTVSLPAAIAARLILDDRIPRRGVLRPVHPEIYDPVLDELSGLGIVCREESTSL